MTPFEHMHAENMNTHTHILLCMCMCVHKTRVRMGQYSLACPEPCMNVPSVYTQVGAPPRFSVEEKE